MFKRIRNCLTDSLNYHVLTILPPPYDSIATNTTSTHPVKAEIDLYDVKILPDFAIDAENKKRVGMGLEPYVELEKDKVTVIRKLDENGDVGEREGGGRCGFGNFGWFVDWWWSSSELSKKDYQNKMVIPADKLRLARVVEESWTETGLCNQPDEFEASREKAKADSNSASASPRNLGIILFISGLCFLLQ